MQGIIIGIDFIVRQENAPLSSVSPGSPVALASNEVTRTLGRDRLETGTLVLCLDGAHLWGHFSNPNPYNSQALLVAHLQMRKSFLSLWYLSPHHWSWTVPDLVPVR